MLKRKQLTHDEAQSAFELVSKIPIRLRNRWYSKGPSTGIKIQYLCLWCLFFTMCNQFIISFNNVG